MKLRQPYSIPSFSRPSIGLPKVATMLSRSSLTALSSAERQLLHRQWQQSGQCIRCFHASIRKRANESNGNGNDLGTPYNSTFQGPAH